MADIIVRPGKLSGSIEPPASKSDAHRALFASFLAGQSKVAGLSEPWSEDIAATVHCLKQLGQGGNLLDCAESGTTLRFLIPVAAALNDARRSPVLTFTGRGRLTKRPLREFKQMLEPHGVELTFPADGSLPLVLKGRLEGGTFLVPGHISSQYLSGLLLALPLLAEDSVVRLTSPLESAPYVAMTLATMKQFGVLVEREDESFLIPGSQRYLPTAYLVEKDYSQAAFWLTAAFGGADIKVTGLSLTTKQGDRAIVDYLKRLASGQRAYCFDLAQTPDLVPVLAVAAALTPAVTRLTNLARLRYKESDRIAATVAALSAIGADITNEADDLVIRGADCSRRTPRLPGGEADSFGDHRIAMSLAVAALFSQEGVLIKGAHCVNKSYPDFFYQLKRLGGKIDGITLGTKSKDQLIW